MGEQNHGMVPLVGEKKKKNAPKIISKNWGDDFSEAVGTMRRTRIIEGTQIHGDLE